MSETRSHERLLSMKGSASSLVSVTIAMEEEGEKEETEGNLMQQMLRSGDEVNLCS